MIERRFIPAERVEVRAEGDEGPVLSGVAVNFGSLSLDLGGFREEFAPGAFADTLESDDIRVVWQHDNSFVFGRVRAGTARVWEDDGALRYTATPPEAQWAKDAMESIKRGDVDQNSFAFMAVDEKWEKRDSEMVRIVTRAKLFEVGPQTMPAYPDTSVAVRSMEQWRDSQAPAPTAGTLDVRRKRLELEEIS
jgi:uncharacterized protein